MFGRALVPGWRPFVNKVYGFYRKVEDVELWFYGMVNAHIASKMI